MMAEWDGQAAWGLWEQGPQYQGPQYQGAQNQGPKEPG